MEVRLASDDVALVVGVVAVAILCALVAFAVDVRASRRGRPPDAMAVNRRTESARPYAVVVAIAAAVAAIVSPVLAAFWALLALNHLAGKSENVPFSRYPMFSRPGDKASTVRFEDSKGRRVNVAAFGIEPTRARKRFGTEVKAAREQHADLDEARRRAAVVLAEWLERVRPDEGRYAREPIAIVVMDYEFGGGRIVPTRTVLHVTAPS